MTGCRRASVVLVVSVAFAMVSSFAEAQTTDSTTEELKKQIEQLTAKVEQLQQKQQQQQEISQQQVDQTVQRVLADAEKRSKLINGENFTAGWDNGFKIQSADGNFLLQPQFQFQVRNVTNFRENVEPDGDDDMQNGFEMRRMKFGFKGNAFTPKLTYNFRWASNRNGGDVELENAFVQYFFRDDWAFRIGQWKDNWTHEETVSSAYQLAVDRSLLNELIGGGQTDYVQGVSLMYAPKDGRLRGELAFIDGIDSGNTGFQDNPSTAGTSIVGVGEPGFGAQGDNFGFSGRIEYALMGKWKEYEQFTSMGDSEDLLVVGAGFNWTQASSNNVYFYTVDVQWNPAAVTGLSMYGAFVGAYQDLNSPDTPPNDIAGNFNNWGFLVQAGYMLTDKWEIFGRYDYTDLDSESNLVSGPENSFQEITVGVNYYLKKHAAKVTIDFNFLPDGVPDGFNLTGIGYQPGEDFQFVIRGQFQLLL